MPKQLELTFENVLGVYNAWWDLVGQLVMDPRIGDHDNWLLTFRNSLRGMLARILAVDKHFVFLHQDQNNLAQSNPNEWALMCEYHAGVIFFGMDSSLECFVFAVNALGFVKSPSEFCNITDPKAVRQIGPANILGGLNNKLNPRPGYKQYFPQVEKLWTKKRSLLSTIFEYHDVTKHRSAVVTGGNLGELSIIDDPKQPGSLMSNPRTLQSITHEYQKFMDELLPIALEESAATFGYSVTKKSRTGQN